MDREIALKKFRSKKILTMKDLTQLLARSVRTSRIFLKEQEALSSINKNARFYTLPDIPKFDTNGIWEYKGIFFSKYRNLKDAILHLILNSEEGLTVKDITQIVGLANNSPFMSTFSTIEAVRREGSGRNGYVYYASEENTYERQKKKRTARITTQEVCLTDGEAVIVLIELIKHPDQTLKQLIQRLERQGNKVGIEVVNKFLEFHGIKKKQVTNSSNASELILKK